MKRRWTFWECVVAAQVLVLSFMVAYLFLRTSTQLLIVELRIGDAQTRAAAAMELGGKGPMARDAIPVLREMLQYPNDLVQMRAVAALGQIGGPQALIDAEKSPDEQVRGRAIMALRGMHLQDPNERQQRLQVFIAELKDPSPGIRQAAAGALGEQGQGAAAAIPDLKEALNDSEFRVRSFAAQALGSIGSFEDVSAMFDSSDVYVRREAIRHIIRFGPDAIPVLTAALDDPSGEVVADAAQALGQMGKKAQSAVPALARALNDPHAGARAQAVTALELVGGEEAIPALREAIDDPDPNVRSWARAALGRLERKASQQ